MTDDRRAELIRLSKIVSERQRYVNGLGMANTYGRTVEERIDMDAEYRVAQDEMHAAYGAYRDALSAAILVDVRIV